MGVWTLNGTAAVLTNEQSLLSPGEAGDFRFQFHPTGASNEHVDRYKTIRAYADSAGSYTTYDALSGHVYWREEQSPGPPPLMEVVAPTDSFGRSFWGLVESVSDESVVTNNMILTLSLVHLAIRGTGAGEFETEADLRAARQTQGP